MSARRCWQQKGGRKKVLFYFLAPVGGAAVCWPVSPCRRSCALAGAASLVVVLSACRGSLPVTTAALAHAGNPAHGAPWLVAGLAVWAAGITALASVDFERFVIPSTTVWVLGVLTAVAICSASAAADDWSYLMGGSCCAVAVSLALFAWLRITPDAIGMGDVRMACLTALGAGALDPAACLAAMAVGFFVAGAVSCAGSRERLAPTPVPLGPFLAVGGLTAVVAGAL